MRKAQSKPAQVHIEIIVWDKINKRYSKVKFGGKLFEIDGKQLRLFQPRVLAAAVDRTTTTITNWVRTGLMPPPTFHVTGTQYKRWYSAAQITMANKVWQKHRKTGRGKFFPTEPFLTEIKKHWHLDFVETGAFDG